MKKLFIFTRLFALIFLSHVAFAEEQTVSKKQTAITDSVDIAKYGSDFAKEFKSDEDKRDFKKLRRYLNQKKIEREDFKTKLNWIYTYNPEFIEKDIKRAESLVANKKDSEPLYDRYYFNGGDVYEYYYDGFPKDLKIGTPEYESYVAVYGGPKTVSELRSSIEEMKDKLREIRLDNQKKKILEQNVEAIQDDIQACEDQIDEALAPEYSNQDFRKGVSLNFTVLIGVLLLGFFFIIYKKSDNSIGKEFLGDNGLQFVTLFVLVIAIILFGILGILEGRELAAILSGISGYILGKGIDKTKPAPTPTMVPIVESSPASTDSDSANSNA